MQHKDFPDSFQPPNCIGYEDSDYFYLYAEAAHKAVRRLCEDQGEGFSITQRGLLKQLAEEGLIEGTATQNTKPVRFGGRSKRVMCLRKAGTQKIIDAAL